MKSRFYFFLTLIVTLFINCKNEKPASVKSADTPSVVASPKGFYKHMKGTIDTFPITMDLVQVDNKGDDYMPYNYKGSYYYDKYQQPIEVYGELDSAGNIILHEYAVSQVGDIYFSGKFDANGSFSGTWRDSIGNKMFKFLLKEMPQDGAVAFDFHNFTDSIKLLPNVAKSPVGYFDLQLLTPTQSTEGSLAMFLKDQIFMALKNDTIGLSYANMSVEGLKNAVRDTFYNMYKETMKEEQVEPDSTGQYPYSFNFAESSWTTVLFNEKDLLSMGYGTYTFTGGVHGNHATLLVSYDLTQKKKLALKDVFLPNYEKTVNAALARSVRRYFKMKANEPLASHLFDNTIMLNDNFCLTKKGILFLYNPYEIAAYAYGEISLFIPFSEIKSVLNPRFVQ